MVVIGVIGWNTPVSSTLASRPYAGPSQTAGAGFSARRRDQEEFMNRMRRDSIELCMNESLPDAEEDPAAVVSENGKSTSNSRAAKS
jgi:hypothetical protein